MDIGTIIAGLQAIGQLFGANRSPQLTPAMAEGEKPKKAQQPINAFIILPNQTPPMDVGVPLLEPLPPMPYTPTLQPPMYTEPEQTTALLRALLGLLKPPKQARGFYRDIPHNAVDMPMYEVPPNIRFPSAFSAHPVLRSLIGGMSQTPSGVPVFRGVPLITDLPNFGGTSLLDLYKLYFGTR